MKKVFIALFTVLTLLSLCLSVSAIDNEDDYADPAIDLPDADASLYSHEFESYDPLLNSVIATEGVYVEDPLDGDQLQTFITDEGKIVVKNDFMVGAVWVESDIELEL